MKASPPDITLKHKFPKDHRTWQQVAINADEWAKLRTQFAEDGPSNKFSGYKHKRQLSKNQTCIFTGQDRKVNTSYKKEDSTKMQKQKELLRVVPTPGKTKIIKIVLSRSSAHKDTCTSCAASPAVHLAGRVS